MRTLATALLCLALAACGWQLRGSSDLSAIDAITVSGASFELRREVVRHLERNGVVVHDYAPLILELGTERWVQRTVAVDALGREAERELRFSTHWQLRDESGKSVNRRQSLQVIRSFNYDPTNVAAASDEEQITREAMYRDVLGQLMRQLDAASANLGEDFMNDGRRNHTNQPSENPSPDNGND